LTGSARFATRLVQFLAAGIPAFGAALATNFLLVDKLYWPKPIAYMVVLWFQMTINYFMCRRLVFEPHTHSSLFRQYARFLYGNGGIRLMEWVFYTVLVEVFHVYYFIVQVAGIILFAVAKFRFAESLFEHPVHTTTPVTVRSSDEAEGHRHIDANATCEALSHRRR
jgi:putative flippase GtrA